MNDVYVYRQPSLIVGVFLFTIGLNLFLMGLLAELVTRTYHESQSKPIYHVRERTNLEERASCRGGSHAGHEGLPLVQGVQFATVVMGLSRCARASPVEDEFVLFAPELAASMEHYPSHAIGQLAPREERLLLVHGSKSVDLRIAVSRIPRARRTCSKSGAAWEVCSLTFAPTHPGHQPHRCPTCCPKHFGWLANVLPDATFLQADIRQIPYREEFDVVCALDVIEHLDEDDVALG